MAGRSSSSSSPELYGEEALLDGGDDLWTGAGAGAGAGAGSGYLEDVLLEFSRSSSKRRKLLNFPHNHRHTPPTTPHPHSHPDHLLLHTDDTNTTSFQNGWTSSLAQNCCQDFDNLAHMPHHCSCERSYGFTTAEVKTPEEGIISSETMYDYSSSSSQKESSSADHIIISDSHQWDNLTPDDKLGNQLYSYLDDPMSISASGTLSAVVEEKRKKRGVGKIVYPFALVKPGGFEGGVATLKDINERILMPPTRPVRHPVGDFACRPLLVSPKGPGLSGKTVVAFTRVHTQGRGTITIIRTRG